jgi:hypothetical protein
LLHATLVAVGVRLERRVHLSRNRKCDVRGKQNALCVWGGGGGACVKNRKEREGMG